MDYGIRISQDGYDVKNAQENQLVYNSKYNSLKISDENTDSATLPTGNRWTYQHGLGYPPSSMVFFKDLFYGGNQYWMPTGSNSFTGSSQPKYDPSASPTSGTTLPGSFTHRAWSDATNITTQIDNLTGSTHLYYTKKFDLIEDNV
jgi:hypothetical protein